MRGGDLYSVMVATGFSYIKLCGGLCGTHPVQWDGTGHMAYGTVELRQCFQGIGGKEDGCRGLGELENQGWRNGKITVVQLYQPGLREQTRGLYLQDGYTATSMPEGGRLSA